MGSHTGSKALLPLVEIIISIGIFAIAVVLTLQLFLLAKFLGNKTSDTARAIFEIQNIAENIKLLKTNEEIEDYLKNLGYSVTHTLFPQLTTDIDDAVKASRVGILAYVHTNAAHYFTVEYREDRDIFVVYNDSFARARSIDSGLQNEVNTGAAIDSITALINNTPGILFSFSLITVN